MTAQMADRLTHEGRTLQLFTLPLEPYLAPGNRQKALADIHRHTACLRGYQASWAVRDGRLYLTRLDGYWDDARALNLQHLFPRAGEDVVAEWFCGSLRCPMGKRLRYAHTDFDSVYERDLLIDIEHGAVIGTSERINTVAPDAKNTPELPHFLREPG